MFRKFCFNEIKILSIIHRHDSVEQGDIPLPPRIRLISSSSFHLKINNSLNMKKEEKEMCFPSIEFGFLETFSFLFFLLFFLNRILTK